MNDQNNYNTLNNNQTIGSAMNFNVPNTDNTVNNTQMVNNNVPEASIQQTPVNTGAMNFSVPNTDNGVNNPQMVNNPIPEPLIQQTPVNTGAMNFNVSNTDNGANNVQTVNNPVLETNLPQTPNVSEVGNQIPQDNNQINNSPILNVSSPAPSAINFNVQNPSGGTEQNMVSNVSLGTISNTINEPTQVQASSINGQENMLDNDQMASNNISQAQELPTNTNANVGSSLEEGDVVKKKTSPIVIIALILVLLVGLAAGYYFLLETPKKVFGTAYDKLLSSVKDTKIISDNYVNYDLSLNISGENENIKSLANVINQININGTSGYNSTDKTFVTNGMILYKNNELLNLSLLLNGNTNISYVKFNNLLDKVLMIEPDADSNGEPIVSTNFNNDFGDYFELRDSILNALKKTLEVANYKKELVDFNGSKATKSTLLVDKKFIEQYYNNLQQDDSYVKNYAKINNMTENEAKVALKKSATEFKDKNEQVIVYTSLIKNEFLRLEFDSSTSNLIVSKNNTSYNYEYSENNTLKYSGIVNINKVADETNLTISMNMPEEKVNLGINCTYSNADSINALDIANATSVNELSEEETNELTSKLTSNNAFKELLNDLGLNDDNLSSFELMI